MNSYNDIPVWENNRRRQVLADFHNDVVTYFNNSNYRGNFVELGDNRIEEPEAMEARRRINLSSHQAHGVVVAAGISPIVEWMPPAIVGGYAQKIDVIVNLFGLDRYSISAKTAVGLIEMAAGVYESNHKAAIIRTFNPLWWLSRVLLWFIRMPFLLFSAIGFNTRRAENSLPGKLVKLMTAVASILTILHLMGLLPAVKALLGVE